MKRGNILIFAVLLVALLFTAGCIEGRMHIMFNLDGSADIDFELFSSSALGVLQREGDDFFADIRRGLARDGFTIEDKKKDGMTGFIAKKHVRDTEELTELTFMGDMGSPEIVIDEGIFYDTYTFTHNMKVKFPGFEDDGDSLAKMLEPDLKFLISFPINPESHNAPVTSDDGRTLQWEMSLVDDTPVEVVLNIPNVPRIALVVIVLITAVILAVVLIRKVAAAKPGRAKAGK